MKKLLLVTFVLVFTASGAYAANFTPTLLKLSADPIIQYDFTGADIEIPVQVSGTPAGLIFCVYTRGMAEKIAPVSNGYLGWHYVNKVDTCVYYSPLKSVGSGANTIVWNGKDQDGTTVSAGEYTYYIWGYDNQGNKELAASHTFPSLCNMMVEKDENGLPMANPIYYTMSNRWMIGNDPLDDTLLETSSVTAAEGWRLWDDVALLPTDHDYFFALITNNEASQGALVKYQWIPGGEAVVQTGWGNSGYSDIVTNIQDNEPGCTTDGNYIYTVDSNHHSNDADADFFIYNMEGFIVDEIDISPWWSDPDDLAAGAQMNGGPNDLFIRGNKNFLNCHCSCLTQMVDPIRYLESGDTEDFYVWANSNGDYVLDHNFENTAALAWVCNDFNVGPYTYTVSADANLFSIVNAYDVGAVTFGLLGPDGTGIGYLAVAGETAGWKRGEVFLDGDTAYDGLYLDNMATGGTHYEWDADKADGKTYFLGHDSISGIITTAISVDEEAPAAFSVAQNSPNPFNPTTTISVTTADAGHVSIDVYNVAGQKVDTVVNKHMMSGSHSFVWDASGFSAGVYFYTVQSGDYAKTMKMTLIK